jgi:hypothetical protein
METLSTKENNLAQKKTVDYIDYVIKELQPDCNNYKIGLSWHYMGHMNHIDLRAIDLTNNCLAVESMSKLSIYDTADPSAFIQSIYIGLMKKLIAQRKEAVFHKVGEAAPAFEPLSIPTKSEWDYSCKLSTSSGEGDPGIAGQFKWTGNVTVKNPKTSKSLYGITGMNATTSSYMGISRNPAPTKQPETMEELYAVELAKAKSKESTT